VLVTGQTNAAQNGIYFVDTVGSGSNGTWVRSNDTNSTGELLAGTIVMVTEGTVYHDTQWKLTTNDPIVIGVSELIFEQNSAFAFGNVYANSTAVLATSVGDVLTLSAGNNISISGNNTSKTVTIGVTGISLNSISNGTSNVNVVSSGGNVTVGIAGTSNVAVFSSNGVSITGDLSVTGNATLSGNILGDRIQNGTTSIDIQTPSGDANISVSGTSNIAVFSSTGANITGTLEASGNVTGGNFLTTGLISATGNITGGNILGNGAGLTGINTFKTVAVTGGNSAVADSIADTLTLTAGSGIAITVDSTTDTVTIAASGGSDIFVDGADFGTVTEAVTASDDLGLVTEAVEAESDLGSIVTSGVFYPDLLVLADVTDFIIYGGNSGQYLGTAGNGILQWQTLDSAPLEGAMAGNILGNNYSITNLATLTATGNITGGNLSVSTGTVTLGGVVNSNANGVGNIGSSTGYFNTVFAKATSAQYADLAEKYIADADYAPGTVVVFGGEQEVTISQHFNDHRVAGVISTNPSYIMNGGLEAEYVATVALTGRVPTKVLGPVAKGDLMVSSAGGYAQACNQPSFGTVIGKSLENLVANEGVIEIVIGVR
jgi:hypothetical protein